MFGKRAGEYAAKYAKANPRRMFDKHQVDAAVRWALAPFDHQPDAAGPFQIQHELQKTMQDLVGIVRREDELLKALAKVTTLQARAALVGVVGNREYNNGWNTALDLHNLLTVSEAIARAALERRESRGGHFRDAYPKKDDACATWNTVVSKGKGNDMQMRREPIPPMPYQLKQIIEDQSR